MSAPDPGLGRLQSTFLDSALSAHGDKWDALWKESFTPWDRGGPSAALGDLVAGKPDLLPPPPPEGARKGRALVPGCGRGYDAVLLAVLGYDVVGLDYSSAAVEAAREKEREMRAEGTFREWEEKEKGAGGRVTWVRGDFFDDAWLREVGMEAGERFDLVFDYTFLCALPLEGRFKWAKRMAELLAPETGRLVCLEWPLNKPATAGGPPWGLSPEVYTAHLRHPGEDVRYGEDGKPAAEEVDRPATENALRRLARFQPDRTHKAGHDGEGKMTDYISVWSH